MFFQGTPHPFLFFHLVTLENISLCLVCCVQSLYNLNSLIKELLSKKHFSQQSVFSSPTINKARTPAKQPLKKHLFFRNLTHAAAADADADADNNRADQTPSSENNHSNFFPRCSTSFFNISFSHARKYLSYYQPIQLYFSLAFKRSIFHRPQPASRQMTN